MGEGDNQQGKEKPLSKLAMRKATAQRLLADFQEKIHTTPERDTDPEKYFSESHPLHPTRLNSTREKINEILASLRKQSAEETIRSLAGYEVYADPATRDKVARALGFAAQCEAGNVRVLNRAWTKAYLDELTAFPDSQFADQVDATSGGFNWISAKHPYTPFDYEPEDFTDTPGPLESIHRDTFH